MISWSRLHKVCAFTLTAALCLEPLSLFAQVSSHPSHLAPKSGLPIIKTSEAQAIKNAAQTAAGTMLHYYEQIARVLSTAIEQSQVDASDEDINITCDQMLRAIARIEKLFDRLRRIRNPSFSSDPYYPVENATHRAQLESVPEEDVAQSARTQCQVIRLVASHFRVPLQRVLEMEEALRRIRNATDMTLDQKREKLGKDFKELVDALDYRCQRATPVLASMRAEQRGKGVLLTFAAVKEGDPDVKVMLQPKALYKPLRKNLTDEEKMILRLYRNLDAINLGMYASSLAKTQAKRQREELETRRDKDGEKGLEDDIAQWAQAEALWETEIQDYHAQLRKARESFPAESVVDSEFRKQARTFLDEAIALIEENRRSVADTKVAAAKRRVWLEFHTLFGERLSAIPRVVAEELLAKGKFGKEMRTITYEGFGMRVAPDGTTTIPRRHYREDFLQWEKDKFKDLSTAYRQNIHIQEGEWNELQKMIQAMRDIVDLKSQLADAGDKLTTPQKNTMAHLMVLMIVDINPSAFQKIIRAQAKQLEQAAKSVLAELGIKGKKRAAFLRAIVKQFREVQNELASSEDLLLHRDQRMAKIAEFEKRWEVLLQEEMRAQSISIDSEAMGKILERWRQVRQDHVLTDMSVLILRLDPKGKIKDPNKKHALLNLHMAAKLLSAGRIDRNVIDFLETAQSYLLRRLEVTKSIRRAVSAHAVSLRVKSDIIRDRDEAVRKGVDAIERALRETQDVTQAHRLAHALLNGPFTEKFNEPGMFRARDRLKALVELIPQLAPLQEALRQSKGKLPEIERLENENAKLQSAIQALQTQMQELQEVLSMKERFRMSFLKLKFEVKRETQQMEARAIRENDLNAKLLLGAIRVALSLDQYYPNNAKKMLASATNWEGLAKRIVQFMDDDTMTKRQKGWQDELYRGLQKMRDALVDVAKDANTNANVLSDTKSAQEAVSQKAILASQIREQKLLFTAAGRQIRALRHQLETAQRVWDATVQSKVFSNLEDIRQDILHKYEKVLPPKPDVNREKVASEILARAA